MPIHGGFISRKHEVEYNKLVKKMIELLLDQLTLQLQTHRNFIINHYYKGYIVNQFFFHNQFQKVLTNLEELE